MRESCRHARYSYLMPNSQPARPKEKQLEFTAASRVWQWPSAVCTAKKIALRRHRPKDSEQSARSQSHPHPRSSGKQASEGGCRALTTQREARCPSSIHLFSTSAVWRKAHPAPILVCRVSAHTSSAPQVRGPARESRTLETVVTSARRRSVFLESA